MFWKGYRSQNPPCPKISKMSKRWVPALYILSKAARNHLEPTWNCLKSPERRQNNTDSNWNRLKTARIHLKPPEFHLKPPNSTWFRLNPPENGWKKWVLLTGQFLAHSGIRSLASTPNTKILWATVFDSVREAAAAVVENPKELLGFPRKT